MNKIKKSLLAIATIATVVSPLSAVVACGGTSGGGNAWKNSKEIVITVDPAFTNVYDHVIADFNASDHHTKDGYYIKKVVKGSQDVLNTIATIGFTEDQVGDILYLPFDKIPDLLQKRSVMPWQENEMKSFMKEIGFSDDEINNDVYAKGVSTMGDKQYPFLIPHNKEGILYFSKKPINGKTPDLVEEAKAGTGAYKLADGWYGLGVLGSVLGDDMDKIVTKTGDKWQSIFIDENSPSKYKKYAGDKALTVKAREAVDKMAEMWASYISKTSSDATYADLYQQDPSASMNAVLALADAGTATSALATVDQMTNFIQHGFVDVSGNFNVGGTQFLGAPGGWLFGINARDNGANSKRLDAIKSIIKDLYSNESAKLFYADDKVPYSQKAYNAVEADSKQTNLEKINQLLNAFGVTTSKKLLATDKIDDFISGVISDGNGNKGIDDLEEWYTKFNAAKSDFQKFDQAKSLISDWDKGLNDNDSKGPSPLELDFSTAYKNVDGFLNTKYSKEILGAQGLAKLLLGLGSEQNLYVDPDNWMMHIGNSEADKKAIKIVSSIFEKGEKDKYVTGNFTGAIHPRKVLSQLIGDGGVEEFQTDSIDIDVTKTLSENAKPYIDKARTKLGTLTPAQIKGITAYVNVAYLPKILDLGKSKVMGDFEKTNTKYEIADKAYTFLTTGGLKSQILDAMQKVKTSSARPDASNPQFGHVFWQAWDDLMFGHKTWFALADVTKAAQDAIKSADGMNAWKDKVWEHIGTAFGSRIVTLDVVGAQSTIS